MELFELASQFFKKTKIMRKKKKQKCYKKF